MEKLSKKEKRALWGQDLFRIFEDHIDDYGWMPENWHEIIEDEIPRFDKYYNDNPAYGDAYMLMYNLHYETKEDKIRPT